MEAIREFEVENMPVTVAVDASGESVHQTGPEFWKKRIALTARYERVVGVMLALNPSGL